MKEIKKATEFTVQRSRWFRGTHVGSRLLNMDTGMMCCMGFYAKACGLDDRQIRDIGGIGSVSEFDEGIYFNEGRTLCVDIENEVVLGGEAIRKGFDSLRDSIYAINDTPSLTDVERERRLTELLASRGVTVHFVD